MTDQTNPADGSNSAVESELIYLSTKVNDLHEQSHGETGDCEICAISNSLMALRNLLAYGD
jgi:hypothetical protein